MTASLYQCGSSGCDEVGLFTSGKVIEVALAAHLVADAEDMRGRVARIERYVVARPLPEVACAREQIMHLESLRVGEPDRGQIELDEARLRVMRIEVHDHEHGRAAILRRLA